MLISNLEISCYRRLIFHNLDKLFSDKHLIATLKAYHRCQVLCVLATQAVEEGKGTGVVETVFGLFFCRLKKGGNEITHLKLDIATNQNTT